MPTCVVSDWGCEAPAGWSTGIGYATNNYTTVGRMKCYVCDEPVCAECSDIVIWYRKRIRACHLCVQPGRPA